MYNMSLIDNLGIWHRFRATVNWQNDASTNEERTRVAFIRFNEELRKYNGCCHIRVRESVNMSVIEFETEEDCVLFKLKFSV